MLIEIIENFFFLLDKNSKNMVKDIMKNSYRFYNEISDSEKKILIAEINKIVKPPILFSNKLPKEVFAFLFPIGKNYTELKSKGISEHELKIHFSRFFENAEKTEFYKNI